MARFRAPGRLVIVLVVGFLLCAPSEGLQSHKPHHHHGHHHHHAKHHGHHAKHHEKDLELASLDELDVPVPTNGDDDGAEDEEAKDTDSMFSSMRTDIGDVMDRAKTTGDRLKEAASSLTEIPHFDQYKQEESAVKDSLEDQASKKAAEDMSDDKFALPGHHKFNALADKVQSSLNELADSHESKKAEGEKSTTQQMSDIGSEAHNIASKLMNQIGQAEGAEEKRQASAGADPSEADTSTAQGAAASREAEEMASEVKGRISAHSQALARHSLEYARRLFQDAGVQAQALAGKIVSKRKSRDLLEQMKSSIAKSMAQQRREYERSLRQITSPKTIEAQVDKSMGKFVGGDGGQEYNSQVSRLSSEMKDVRSKMEKTRSLLGGSGYHKMVREVSHLKGEQRVSAAQEQVLKDEVNTLKRFRESGLGGGAGGAAGGEALKKLEDAIAELQSHQKDIEAKLESREGQLEGQLAKKAEGAESAVDERDKKLAGAVDKLVRKVLAHMAEEDGKLAGARNKFVGFVQKFKDAEVDAKKGVEEEVTSAKEKMIEDLKKSVIERLKDFLVKWQKGQNEQLNTKMEGVEKKVESDEKKKIASLSKAVGGAVGDLKEREKEDQKVVDSMAKKEGENEKKIAADVGAAVKESTKKYVKDYVEGYVKERLSKVMAEIESLKAEVKTGLSHIRKEVKADEKKKPVTAVPAGPDGMKCHCANVDKFKKGDVPNPHGPQAKKPPIHVTIHIPPHGDSGGAMDPGGPDPASPSEAADLQESTAPTASETAALTQDAGSDDIVQQGLTDQITSGLDTSGAETAADSEMMETGNINGDSLLQLEATTQRRKVCYCSHASGTSSLLML